MAESGVREFENKWYNRGMLIINNNPDKPYLEAFFNYMLTKNAVTSCHSYLGYVCQFLTYVNKVNPADITLGDYTKYMVSIKSHTSANRIAVYSALKKFSKFVAAANLGTDYMQYVDRPKQQESNETIARREIGFLNNGEVGLYLKGIRDEYNYNDLVNRRDYAIVLTLLTTGIRCSALMKLDLSDIDLENGILMVTEKGNIATRKSLPPVTIEAIRKYIKERNSMERSTNALFISNWGMRISKESIYHLIAIHGACIQGKKISPHKFRATYGTISYDKTHDIYYVQQAMGHASPTTTEKYIRGNKDVITAKSATLMAAVMEDII